MPAKITFLTVITSLILLVLPWWQNPLQLTPAASAQAEPEPIEVTGFDLISASEGWLRLGQHLYLTRNSDQSWTEITPPNLEPAIIQAVWFVDAQSGWLASTGLDASGSITYRLARTADGGATWQVTPLSLFAPGDPDALAEAVYLHFVDGQAGCLVALSAARARPQVQSNCPGAADAGR